jgi:hypothetical protein
LPDRLEAAPEKDSTITEVEPIDVEQPDRVPQFGGEFVQVTGEQS